MKLLSLSKLAMLSLTITTANQGIIYATEPVVSDEVEEKKVVVLAPVIVDSKKVKTYKDMWECILRYVHDNHEGRKPRVYSLKTDDDKYILNIRTEENDELHKEVINLDITDMINRLLKNGDQKTKEDILNYIDRMTGGSFKPKV